MYPVTFNTLPENVNLVLNNSFFQVHSVLVKHLIPTIGLRFDFVGGKSVTYSCDTEPCEQLLRLAQGVDYLLQETAGPGKGHTSAQQAGQIAATAKVNHLIFIHYDQRVGIENLVKMAESEYSGDIVAATDGMELF
jgi:ribonuclease Z